MAARLEVITGPMFSGKSEELVRRLRRETFINRKIILVKPKIDNRATRNIFELIKMDSRLSNYKNLKMASVVLTEELDYLVQSFEPDTIAVDECQLFVALDNGDVLAFEFLDYISTALDKRKNSNFKITVAGLDMDAWGKPFGIMPYLMAMADEVLKLTAECTECNGANPAIFTQKIGGSDQLIEVGDIDKYAARCRACFKKQV